MTSEYYDKVMGQLLAYIFNINNIKSTTTSPYYIKTRNP
jgi:hypothetical protein